MGFFLLAYSHQPFAIGDFRGFAQANPRDSRVAEVKYQKPDYPWLFFKTGGPVFFIPGY
jgi:hypothetical protein